MSLHQPIEFARVRHLGRLLDRRLVTFLDHFDTMLDAYRAGAMQYGCLVAVKPHE